MGGALHQAAFAPRGTVPAHVIFPKVLNTLGRALVWTLIQHHPRVIVSFLLLIRISSRLLFQLLQRQERDMEEHASPIQTHFSHTHGAIIGFLLLSLNFSVEQIVAVSLPASSYLFLSYYPLGRYNADRTRRNSLSEATWTGVRPRQHSWSVSSTSAQGQGLHIFLPTALD